MTIRPDEMAEPGGPMLLDIEKMDSPRGYRLVGELDASNVATLSDSLKPDIEQGGDLTLHRAGLAFRDSTCIHVLVPTAPCLEGRGHLILASPGNLAPSIP